MIKKNIFTFIASVAIIIASTVPIPEDPPLAGVPMIDKWVHFVMYGGLAGTMWLDLFFIRKERELTSVFWAAVLIYPVFLGGLMEVVQESFTTCRNGDMIDFWADCIGVVLGNILALLIFLYLVKIAKK